MRFASIRLLLWISRLAFVVGGAVSPGMAQTNISRATAVTTTTLSMPDENVADKAYLLAHYTKYEYEIPMRDGTRLFTSVFAPKDVSTRYPILLQRTPYGIDPYGVGNYPEPRGQLKYYAKEKFIFAYQDVRGRTASQGEFVHMRPHKTVKNGPQDFDESADTYDTIDWLTKNLPNNNGKVGMMGISYPGFYAAAGMIDSHPALKAVSPQAPISDWFIGDDFHHNGVFYLAHAFRFFSSFGQKLDDPVRQDPIPFDYKTPDGYEFHLRNGPLANYEKIFKTRIEFWSELMEHTTYDSFWQARNILPHLKNIKAAVLTVGGWYDAENLYGPLKIYESVERNNPGIINSLVMGPWDHGGWHRGDGDRLGHIRFHAKTSEFYREKIELPFLKHFLKDDPKLDLPEAWVFETGTWQWRRYDSWPPKNVEPQTFYFRTNSRLASDAPQPQEAAFSEYVSDPAKPVPFIPNIAMGMTREHMLDDQRFASSRPDVLVFASDILTEDLTVAGPIEVRLRVSTTGTDSDWVVKLVDVYSGDHPNPEPNPAGVEMGGYQQLVRAEAMRGKFRESFEHPKPFEPGQITEINYRMPDVYHTFRRGHRMMVHVQSSWFPVTDRNPQTYVDIYKARPEDFQKATQRVFHSPDAPSSIRFQRLATPW